VREADWRFTIVMPGVAGGTSAGPPPGVHGRAALASCLVIGYGMCLARAGLTPKSLEVVVQADYDDRGLLGMADVYPGYLKVLHIFRDAQPVTGRVVFGPRPQPV